MTKKTWPKELKSWRQKFGLKQTSAAKLLGIGYGTLTKYECGERFPHKLMLQELRRKMRTVGQP